MPRFRALPCTTSGMVPSCRALAAWISLAACAAAQVVIPPNTGVPNRAPTVPSPQHDLALEALAAGDYDAAGQIAVDAHRGSVQIGGGRWIDTIASAALLGECLFEVGDFAAAVAHYEEAMLLEAAHADWMLSLQFPPQPLRAAATAGRVGTWGRSRRNTTAAAIPDTVAIRTSAGDPQDVLKRGGALVADFDRPVRPQEIMRMLVIAIYRHGAILGPLARESAAVDKVEAALAQRRAPANHWSQAWIDVALGVACWSQGKPEAAGPLLTRGLVIGNQFDHALTPWGLIVLGRIALDADRFEQAAEIFEEATYAAAGCGDIRALEEAFALAATAHALAGTRGVPPTIARGCDEARGRLPALRARLLAIQAEELVTAGDPRRASAALADIDPRLLQSKAGKGPLGARVKYAKSLIGYAAGNQAEGDTALGEALAIARARSPRLFQTATLAAAVAAGSGAVSDRLADEFFALFLADPAGRDFARDPLEALAVSSADHSAAFAAWQAVAGRRDADSAVEVAEAALRHRWLATQALGGRRLAIDRLLAADPRGLDPRVAALRASLLGDHADLAEVVDAMARIRGEVAAAVVAVPPAAVDVSTEPALAARRSVLEAGIAAGREAIPLSFPPLMKGAEIRGRLEPRQLILSFRQDATGLVGMLESRDRFATWQVRQAAGLPAEIVALAKGLCLFDADAPVVAERLAEGDWQAAAERIERMLFENSRITLAEGVDELVIVPDGWLWYVPFELLPIGTGAGIAEASAGPARLRDRCRIRYAPTRSLAVGRRDERGPGFVGVHAGRMWRGDKPDAAATVATLRGAMPEAAVASLGAAPTVPEPLAAAACDTLLVLDAIAGTGPASAWPLLPSAGGKDGSMTFADWLLAPVKRPRVVMLPGLATAMADGLAKPPPRPGDELFMAATDLLAAGADTALLSRWRMGGKACTDLMTEFLRDSQGSAGRPAAVAWQRAVDVVLAEPPDVVREPRIRDAAAPLDAPLHPIFWAGYMLIDCGATAAAAAAAPGVP